MAERDVLLKILDLARWAPSGDNTQPWRFEIAGDGRLAVHGFDTRDRVLYDFEGLPSRMAHGALLETIRLAATRFGLHAHWQLRAGVKEANPIYDVAFSADGPIVAEDPLTAAIAQRAVQRRMMRLTALNEVQRNALRQAVGQGYELEFFESFEQRFRIARLLFASAAVRLTCPEAYAVHRDAIEWGARYSKDRIPEAAVGVDRLSARLMRWVMKSWRRVEFFNRYLGGTWIPRIELDFLPALACGAHVMVIAKERPRTPLDYVAAGVAMQRLWLCAGTLGLHAQPQMTPLIFRWYVRAGRRFSASAEISRAAAAVADRFEAVAHLPHDRVVFFCRVGRSKPPTSRSLRLDLNDLLIA